MLINRKHFFTRSHWIVFSRRRGGPAFPAAGAAFYGDSPKGGSSATEFSPTERSNSGYGDVFVGGGVRWKHQGISVHGRPQCEYFRGYEVRGDLGTLGQQERRYRDRHA